MVAHQTEPAYGNSKDLVKFLQSILDPILTPWSSFVAHKMSPTNAARNTMIPTTYGGINKSRTGDSHSKAPEETVKSIHTSYQIQSARQSLCLSFFVFRQSLCLSFFVLQRGSSSSPLVLRLRWAGLATLGRTRRERRYSFDLERCFALCRYMLRRTLLDVRRFVFASCPTGILAIPPVFSSASMHSLFRFSSSLVDRSGPSDSNRGRILLKPCVGIVPTLSSSNHFGKTTH
jgi:hypothetical protein